MAKKKLDIFEGTKKVLKANHWGKDDYVQSHYTDEDNLNPSGHAFCLAGAMGAAYEVACQPKHFKPSNINGMVVEESLMNVLDELDAVCRVLEERYADSKSDAFEASLSAWKAHIECCTKDKMCAESKDAFVCGNELVIVDYRVNAIASWNDGVAKSDFEVIDVLTAAQMNMNAATV